MNIQEIIESGIIELYVMNALPEDEAARVEALALAHPEIYKEIEDTQIVLQKYAEAHAVLPNPGLKDTILKRIEKESLPQNPSTSTDILAPKKVPLPMVSGSTISIKPLWIWAAAASLAAVVFLFQNINQKKALNDCAAENNKLIENQKVVAYKLDILRRPDTKPLELKGLDISPNSKIIVYWNAKEKATLLSIQNLPVPPKGKQYQLWAIVDKKPVDAGVFVYDITAIQPMKGFESAEAFAVTLENEGGSVVPTMNEMYVFSPVL